MKTFILKYTYREVTHDYKFHNSEKLFLMCLMIESDIWVKAAEKKASINSQRLIF